MPMFIYDHGIRIQTPLDNWSPRTVNPIQPTAQHTETSEQKAPFPPHEVQVYLDTERAPQRERRRVRLQHKL